jgi:hypothetical protein
VNNNIYQVNIHVQLFCFDIFHLKNHGFEDFEKTRQYFYNIIGFLKIWEVFTTYIRKNYIPEKIFLYTQDHHYWSFFPTFSEKYNFHVFTKMPEKRYLDRNIDIFQIFFFSFAVYPNLSISS